MTVDERLAAQATAAEARIAACQAELDTARDEFQRAVRALYLGGASLREIADTLGISHQRVHQLLDLPRQPEAKGRPRRGSTSQLDCSFCGRNQAEVSRLIAGPGIYVCDICVGRARDVVDHGRSAMSARTRIDPGAAGTRCGFCGKRDNTTATAGDTAICTECLDLCDEIMTEERDSSSGRDPS